MAVVPGEATPWPWPDARRSPLRHGNGETPGCSDCLEDILGRELSGSDPCDLVRIKELRITKGH